MSEFFETDFYQPTVSFSALPEAERATTKYRGGDGWSSFRRTAAGFAFAGALLFSGSAVSSNPVLRVEALRGSASVESPRFTVRPRRGKPLPSPVSDAVSARALRARAYFEVLHPDETEPPDPDYGL